jgi:hypothetical protein
MGLAFDQLADASCEDHVVRHVPIVVRETTRMRLELEFEDTFEGATLDPARWLPFYLPHWSSRERAAARYELRDGVLRLRIEAGQQPWCPEFDGEIKVSSLQTGARTGQHRFNPAAVVREQQSGVRLYTSHYGRIEVRAKATDDPEAMVALWLIGYEGGPQSAEICVCEIFGRDVGPAETGVGVGVHPFDDPDLRDDFSRETVAIDAREFHVYTADWTPDGVTFSIDGEPIKTTDQSPSYPLQLMLGIYAFPATGRKAASRYPKEFAVDYVRGYRLAAALSGSDPKTRGQS